MSYIDTLNIVENGQVVTYKFNDSAAHEAIKRKANKEGIYDGFTSGLAKNLVDTRGNGTFQSIKFRSTGGTMSVRDEGDNSAIVKKVIGKSLVWNQHFEAPATPITSVGITTTKVSTNVVRLTGTPSDANPLIMTSLYEKGIVGHKYYTYVKKVAGDWPTTGSFSSSYHNMRANEPFATCEGGRIKEYEALAEGLTPRLSFQLGSIPTNAAIDLTLELLIVDLTQMFGVGDEPTAAEFEAMFPKHDYPYNAGEIINVAPDSIVTNGFNQWDEEWLHGYYKDTDGTFVSNDHIICSKNPIKVIADKEYYFKFPEGATGMYISKYDADGKYLGYVFINTITHLFTPGAGCGYIHFNTLYVDDITTYNHDICINLSWSGYRDGEYEEYWKQVRNLGIKTASSNDTVPFSAGLRGAGTAYDESSSTKGTRRFAIVDMGDLTWYRQTSQDVSFTYFTSDGIQSLAKLPATNAKGNILTSGYVNVEGYALVNTEHGLSTMDKSIMLYSTGILYVRDDDNAELTGTQFKEAVRGIKLIYELATPEEFVYDEPLNWTYKVEDFGTESITPTEDTQENPCTAPLSAYIKYNEDFTREVANLPQNYVAKDSMALVIETNTSNKKELRIKSGSTVCAAILIEDLKTAIESV